MSSGGGGPGTSAGEAVATGVELSDTGRTTSGFEIPHAPRAKRAENTAGTRRQVEIMKSPWSRADLA